MSNNFSIVKNSLKISDVVQKYGVNLDRNNRGICPFHANSGSKTFSIKEIKQKWACFSCNKTGDVIDFVSNLFNIKNSEALEILNNDFALGLNLNIKPDFKAVEQYKKEQEEKQRQKYLEKEAYKKLCSIFRYKKRIGLRADNIEYLLNTWMQTGIIPEEVFSYVK